MRTVVFVDHVARYPMAINSSDVFQDVVARTSHTTTHFAQVLGKAQSCRVYDCNTLFASPDLPDDYRQVIDDIVHVNRVNHRLLLYACMRELVAIYERAIFHNYLQDAWDAVYYNHLFGVDTHVVHVFLTADPNSDNSYIFNYTPGIYKSDSLHVLELPCDVHMLFDPSVSGRVDNYQELLAHEPNRPAVLYGLVGHVAFNYPFECVWLLLWLLECKHNSYNPANRPNKIRHQFCQVMVGLYSAMSTEVLNHIALLIAARPHSTVVMDSLPLVSRLDRFPHVPTHLLFPPNCDFRSAWVCHSHSHRDLTIVQYHDAAGILADHAALCGTSALEFLDKGLMCLPQAWPLVEKRFYQLFDRKRKYYYSVNTMPALATSDSSTRALMLIEPARIMLWDKAFNPRRLLDPPSTHKMLELHQSLSGTILDVRVQCSADCVVVQIYDMLLLNKTLQVGKTLQERQDLIAVSLLPKLNILSKGHNRNRAINKVHFLKVVYRRATCHNLLKELNNVRPVTSLFFIPSRCAYTKEYDSNMLEWRNSSTFYTSLYYDQTENSLCSVGRGLKLVNPGTVDVTNLGNRQVVDMVADPDFVNRFRQNAELADNLAKYLSFMRVNRHCVASDTVDYVANKLAAMRITVKWLRDKLQLLSGFY